VTLVTPVAGPLLSCREALDFLADYLEGELAPEVRVAFERHLARCSDCERYLESYREAIRLGRLAWDAAGPAADVPEALVQAILASRGAAVR
jgi:anti-sigma factor RsiW